MNDAAQPRWSKTFGSHETTIDNRTGLEWQAAPFPNRMKHAEAEKACAGLTLGGHSDWRLPTLEELESIRDVTRHDPCVDPAAFPNTPSEWFWASTPYAASPADCAWGVSFDFGYADGVLRGFNGRVRAVRGPSRQSSASLGDAERR